MSMWKTELQNFPQKWTEILGRFEDGLTRVTLHCKGKKEAMVLRFEWYAFKRKMRLHQETMAYEQRMFPKLNLIRAELGQLKDGRYALRLILQDSAETSRIIEEALARIDAGETDDEDDFVRQRDMHDVMLENEEYKEIKQQEERALKAK